MPFDYKELLQAYHKYKTFISSDTLNHSRYIFPFFSGTYFVYRKIDVLRLVSIAKCISSIPKYLDVGCGNCDFLDKIRFYLPNAIGIELDTTIFFLLYKTKPSYVQSIPIECFNPPDLIDVSFVGWMEKGIDFRKFVSKISRCIVTTFDTGGQCGINGNCEYDEFGLKKVASWRTPSWIDVNIELMNKYYTKDITDERIESLLNLKTSSNLWCVYSQTGLSETIKESLKIHFEKEKKEYHNEKYDFESILDELGFRYLCKLDSIISPDKRLWDINFY